MLDLQAVLTHVIEVGGSDLHVKGGSPPRVRVNGDLRPTPFPPIERTEVEECLRVIMPVDRIEEFHRTGEADFSVSVEGMGRFRGFPIQAEVAISRSKFTRSRGVAMGEGASVQKVPHAT